MRTYHNCDGIRLIKEMVCDRCGTSLFNPERGQYSFSGLRIEGGGHPGSSHFPEGHNFRIEVCEKCSAEWFQTFQHNPLKIG